jgi:hypothetical protein
MQIRAVFDYERKLHRSPPDQAAVEMTVRGSRMC